MKKLLFVFAVAAFATACNNDSEKTETTTDTTVVAPVDTTVKMAPDTTAMAPDTTKM